MRGKDNIATTYFCIIRGIWITREDGKISENTNRVGALAWGEQEGCVRDKMVNPTSER